MLIQHIKKIQPVALLRLLFFDCLRRLLPFRRRNYSFQLDRVIRRNGFSIKEMAFPIRLRWISIDPFLVAKCNEMGFSAK